MSKRRRLLSRLQAWRSEWRSNRFGYAEVAPMNIEAIQVVLGRAGG